MKIPANEVTLNPYLLGKKWEHAKIPTPTPAVRTSDFPLDFGVLAVAFPALQ